MSMQQSKKTRLLWIVETEFDIQHNRTRLIEMINHLQQSYSVQLLTGYCNKKLELKTLHNKIIYYDSAKIPYIKRFTRYINQCRIFGSILKFFKPNIVLFNCKNLILFKYAVSKRQKYNLRLIFDVRTLPVETSAFKNWINSMLLGSCLRYAAKYFNGITYITNLMKHYCTKIFKLHPHTSTIWTSGVNTELFSPSIVTSDSGSFTILYHGAISKQRNIDSLIKAIFLLKHEDIRLVLLGDGDEFENLKKLAERLEIKNHISFNKSVNYEEIPKWIHRCDVGILPFQNWNAWNVSSPIKLFEYLACAKPVIVTDIPAHSNVLENCDFAFWIKQSSPQDIAEAILQSYNKRRDLECLGLAATKLVQDKYTWAKQANKLKLFFDSVLSNK